MYIIAFVTVLTAGALYAFSAPMRPDRYTYRTVTEVDSESGETYTYEAVIDNDDSYIHEEKEV